MKTKNSTTIFPHLDDSEGLSTVEEPLAELANTFDAAQEPQYLVVQNVRTQDPVPLALYFGFVSV